MGNASIATPKFPVVNAITGFTSITLKTVSKVTIDIRRMLQVFETKPTLFKVNNRNTRTKCKIRSKTLE